jgi:hypothetical protein
MYHIYMSQMQGFYDVGVEDVGPEARMNYRGSVPTLAAAQQFETEMSAHGHLVVVRPTKVDPSKEHHDPKKDGDPQGPAWVHARDLLTNPH